MFGKKSHPVKIKINYHAQALKNQKKKKRGNVNAQKKKVATGNVIAQKKNLGNVAAQER